jgi:DNA-binding NtrC family response regulator
MQSQLQMELKYLPIALEGVAVQNEDLEGSRHSATPLMGQSVAMRGVLNQINRVAGTDASVLLIGESGTGKELVARAIHDRSNRRDRPFLAINCGAIAASLIEAEIFGYEKGSFTGAVRAHAGVFERAEGGTLFLDEVAEMPCESQVRLLRVLETRRFFRVGGSAEITVDVRVVAATNRCPLTAVREGKLRNDVLYRLAVFPIQLPSLRERGDDVELLARHFLAQLNAHAGTRKCLSPRCIQMLRTHSWPGNVRELRNAIERAFILGDESLEISPLEAAGRELANGESNLTIAVGAKLHDAERSLIEATLVHYDGDKRQAAEVLGCSLKTLYNKLHGYSRQPAYLGG